MIQFDGYNIATVLNILSFMIVYVNIVNNVFNLCSNICINHHKSTRKKYYHIERELPDVANSKSTDESMEKPTDEGYGWAITVPFFSWELAFPERPKPHHPNSNQFFFLGVDSNISDLKPILWGMPLVSLKK